MLFEQTLTIPKLTLSTAPVSATLGIAHGIITKIMVRPRSGHASLAHCTISYHNHQIAPSTPDMDIHGDTFPIDWEEYFEVYQPAYELVIKGWNEDDTYPHTFTVYVVVLPRKAIIANAIVDAFKGIFRVFFPKKILVGG